MSRSTLPAQRRVWVVVTSIAMVVAMASASVMASLSTELIAPAEAAAGNPGVPSDPVVVFEEGLENVTQQTGLTQYTGPTKWGSQTYTVDLDYQDNQARCNGWIVSYNTAVLTPSSERCTDVWTYLQVIAWALGRAQGMTDPIADDNHALVEWTRVTPQSAGILIQSGDHVAQAIPGHFYNVSAYFAATDTSTGPDRPSLKFSLLVDGQPQVLATDLDPYTSFLTGFNPISKDGIDVYVASLNSSSVKLSNAANLGFQLYNATATGDGNNFAFDFPQILDVTPQLDQSFVPSVVSIDATTTLRYTITNTSELGVKEGWSFSVQLPQGMQATGQSTTTCGNGSVNVNAGLVTASGDLGEGVVSCTVNVPVSVSEHGTYSISASSVTLDGLNPPGAATLTTAELALSAAASPTVVEPNDEVTYTFTVTNTGATEVTGITINAAGDDPDATTPGFSGTGALGTITCDSTTLAPGESATCEGTYQVTDDDIEAGEILLTATASGSAVGASGPIVSNPDSVDVDTVELGEVTTTRTITYTGAGSSTPSTVTQTVIWVTMTNPVTGVVTYTTESSGYPALLSPSVTGYHPNVEEVPALTVPDRTTTQPQSSTVTVTYTGDTQTVNIVYVDEDDEQAIVGTDQITGPSESAVGFTEEDAQAGAPEGYDYASMDNVTTFDADTDEDQTITVYVTHHHTSGTLTTSRTITYTGAGDRTPSPVTQSISWATDTDEATGEVIYTTTATEYPALSSPVVGGFHVDVAQVSAAGVTSPTTTTPQSSTVTVTYTADTQTANVVYVDDEDEYAVVTPVSGMTTVLTGPSGSAVGFTASTAQAGIPIGYELTMIDNVTTFDFDTDTDQTITVHLVHQRAVDTLTTTRTITYTGAGDRSPASVTQEVTWTVTIDHVTHVVTYETESGGYPSVAPPAVGGYHSDVAQVLRWR